MGPQQISGICKAGLVRATLKILLWLQRLGFARTFLQVVENADVCYFFFPHQPSLAPPATAWQAIL
jgi:hypothetical protein